MGTIFSEFSQWYFLETPKEILRIWRNFLRFGLNYFSTPLLLKTFFSHWRNYKWDYGRGFDLQRYLGVFSSNMISRLLGMIMRSMLIIVGILAESAITITGVLALAGWIVLPFILVVGFYFSMKILF